MRAHVLAALACAVAAVVAAGSRAAEAKTPREIIEDAIFEAGGREALARYGKPYRQEFKVKSTGVRNFGGNAPMAESKGRMTIWFPDKLRAETTRNLGGQAATVGVVFDGKQGMGRGVSGGGGRLEYNDRPLGEAEMEGYRKLLYAQWIATLLPLDDKAFELSELDETQLDERPAIGVRVSRKDRPEVQLYFDKESMMLVKLVWRPNDTTEAEQRFDDFAELDGLVYPRKISSFNNGKFSGERQVTEFEFLDKVEGETFEKF
jgi:hypothetical protein